MAEHHWVEEETSERIRPKLTRYQRTIRFLQEAFAVGGVGGSFKGTTSGQDAVRNAMGVGISRDTGRDTNEGSSTQD